MPARQDEEHALLVARLKTAFARAGVTPSQLQRISKGRIKQRTVAGWLKGRAQPNAIYLARVAKAIGTTASQLLGEGAPPVGGIVLDRARVEEVCACEDRAALPGLLPRTKPFAFSAVIPDGCEIVSEQLARAEEERAMNHIRAVSRELWKSIDCLRQRANAVAAGETAPSKIGEALDDAKC